MKNRKIFILVGVSQFSNQPTKYLYLCQDFYSKIERNLDLYIPTRIAERIKLPYSIYFI